MRKWPSMPEPPENPFSTIEQAVADLRAGKFVVVVDDEDRENEGDLVIAAEKDDARGDQFHGPRGSRPDLSAR